MYLPDVALHTLACFAKKGMLLMLSDDELLDHDASDSIFAKETPREDSPRTFTRHLINRFGISSKGGLRLSSIILRL